MVPIRDGGAIEIPKRYIHRPKKMSHPPSFNVSRPTWFDLCVGVSLGPISALIFQRILALELNFLILGFSPTERDFRERD